MRPKQWVKNLLVLAAPLAAGLITDSEVLVASLTAMLSFVLASSAVYSFNDVQDVAADREHPLKRHRPIAAGHLSTAQGLVLSALLAVASLAVAWLTTPQFTALVAIYLAVQVVYALYLKHEPVLDLVVVASGFLMRAVGGGLAASLPISHWFLLVAGFGSLFMVAGKRYSEFRAHGEGGATRRSLTGYTESYLRFTWTLSAAATVMSYSLWAAEQALMTDQPWHTLSIAAFVLGILRYAVDVDAGRAQEPEEIVWGDRVLQAVALVWLALLLAGVTNV